MLNIEREQKNGARAPEKPQFCNAISYRFAIDILINNIIYINIL